MVNIHQFKSRAEGFCVNSWILETETSLILVDSQFLVSEVEGLLSQIRKLGKPLEATFITHPHPDHFNGAGLISRISQSSDYFHGSNGCRHRA
jgi:glyoxylase-like metal-dependent hydrolase (beta-lactamase superfamily II)